MYFSHVFQYLFNFLQCLAAEPKVDLNRAPPVSTPQPQRYPAIALTGVAQHLVPAIAAIIADAAAKNEALGGVRH